MNLIVGLGNPGEKYVNTRHNAGFMFVEFLAKNSELIHPWKLDKYVHSEVSTVDVTIKDNLKLAAILAKPQTYMNKSGVAVQELIKKNDIPQEGLVIVHDDLDMELGNFKIQHRTGPKVHNGLSSIEATIKRNDFLRIRIGVDNRHGEFRIPGEAYVLQNFPLEEKKLLDDLFITILQRMIMHFKNPAGSLN